MSPACLQRALVTHEFTHHYSWRKACHERLLYRPTRPAASGLKQKILSRVDPQRPRRWSDTLHPKHTGPGSRPRSHSLATHSGRSYCTRGFPSRILGAFLRQKRHMKDARLRLPPERTHTPSFSFQCTQKYQHIFPNLATLLTNSQR